MNLVKKWSRGDDSLAAAVIIPLPSVRPLPVVGAGQPGLDSTDDQEIPPRLPRPVSVNEETGTYVVDFGLDPERRREIELIGMRVAMDYERDQGWHPEDVSGENHGFDVRSIRYNEEGALVDIRYIEVKARAKSGSIRLSANEWKKARHYGQQFWLYVVTMAGTDEPRLQSIQNPSAQFTLEEDLFSTGYIVPEKSWQQLVIETDER